MDGTAGNVQHVLAEKYSALSSVHSPEVKVIASFVDTTCRGNTHIVVQWPKGYIPETALINQALALSRQFPHHIVVFLCGAQVMFTQNGHIIQRCGSGSIAAAHALNVSRACQLHSPYGPISIGRTSHGFFYESVTLPYTPGRKKPWSSLVNQRIKNCIYVGSRRDYCIVELYRQKDLSRCQVNAKLMSRVSARSLIVTAKSTMPHVDYVMRYFNPRYGCYEDPATGSANAMLANYWQSRLQQKRVRVRQLSAIGGAFVVEQHGALQRVIGETREIKNVPEINAIKAELCRVDVVF